MYAGIAFSVIPPYSGAESCSFSVFRADADCKQKGKCCRWLHLQSHGSKHVCMCGVCMQHDVSGNACVLRGRNMNQFKSIFYTEMTYLSNLLQSVPFYCVKGLRIHTPLDWNHCHWENLANTLRGAAILKVSESLIFSRKSSRRIYGKWESGDGKWSSSAGYSVITAFFYRQAMVSSHFQACG